MKIGVLGPGAIGGLIAALLWKSGNEVYCIGTEEAVDSINQKGISVKSDVFGDFSSYPIAMQVAAFDLDVIIVSVKSPSLEVALRSISTCADKGAVIVPLLNGIGHRELIRRQYGARVAVGSIGAIEVLLSDGREILHKSPMVPHVDISSNYDVEQEQLELIATALKESGLSVDIRKNEDEVIWRKLIRLSAVATMTAYTQSPIGEVRTDRKSRACLENVVIELCQIARTQGFECMPQEVMHQIDGLPSLLCTSMQRDIAAGKPSEIESILGEPIRFGRSIGLSLPMMESCYMRLISSIKE